MPAIAANDLPAPAAEVTPRPKFPAWLLSALFHAVLIVCLGWFGRNPPEPGGAEITGRVGTIVLLPPSSGEDHQEQESAAEEPTPEPQPKEETEVPPEETVEKSEDSASSVPAPAPLPGLLVEMGKRVSGGKPAKSKLSPAAALGQALGGKTTVRVFGLEGEGNRFAFVFDRSVSMRAYGGAPLAAAKAELLQALQGLEDHHQFQILFYNNTLREFDRSGRLIFGTTAEKRRAAQFIEGIQASGGTSHELALAAALRLRPDVLFFLTDADEPKLFGAQLARIRRLNQGTIVHTIEFGRGPYPSPNSFLRTVAEQNGGQYAYVDISRLPSP